MNRNGHKYTYYIQAVCAVSAVCSIYIRKWNLLEKQKQA